MLKISEFAQLAHTTRRTLILYDNNNLFKPTFVNSEGYRFYDYQKINELNTILTLKKLGLSIDEIKTIVFNKDQISEEFLLQLKSQVNDQISDLLKVNTAIDQRIMLKNSFDEAALYQPYEHNNKERFYWKSTNLENCSTQQIAKAFSEFYSNLDRLMGANGNYSGFIINLPKIDFKAFEDANFSLIKEATVPVNNNSITTITRPAGNYLAVDVISNYSLSCQNIRTGLNHLKEFIKTKNLRVDSELWQTNLGKNEAGSPIIRLELQIQ
ncbi:MerR family transcriptional regulator [Companilactobacillus kimchiensis]|uniref:Transcriptional regulator n=1 Tax=Companilactobacillus kimchiensis TaxID=993692 RepID=A0A0R2LFU4_9LACO|nr:MerR family transcriptional regulator [Companilactobacillus kimchiensis]KRN98886.1 transcriptional regulator [Companilactobacillus kimchiensis]